MTALNHIAQSIARDYAGLPATFKIGDRRVHPQYGVIVLISGAYQVNGRVSNHWHFTVEETGEHHADYGDDWERA